MPTESGTQMKSTFISFEKGRHYIETSELPILLSEQALLNQCESSSGQERISISMQKKNHHGAAEDLYFGLSKCLINSLSYSSHTANETFGSFKERGKTFL